jgi:tRNA A22 N-methylase
LNTKSSTEAELVGVFDGSNNILWLRNFLIEQGYRMEAATIFQDNQSTLALLESGRSMNKATRHINIRYFYLKSKVEEGEVILEYKPTDEMIADVLTKPLQGQKFFELRDALLNW